MVVLVVVVVAIHTCPVSLWNRYGVKCGGDLNMWYVKEDDKGKLVQGLPVVGRRTLHLNDNRNLSLS